MKTAYLALCLLAAGCIDTTGGGIVSFNAAAAGPADLPGGPITFTNGVNYDITLTKAVLHVGSLYFNQNAQASIQIASACVQSGVYVGEVLSSLYVDILDPTPQPFPKPGDGLALPALEGEVWLNFPDNGIDVNVPDSPDDPATDPNVVLSAEGTASYQGTTWPFTARTTISSNRVPPVANPALPGESLLCIERIVNGICPAGGFPPCAPLTLSSGGTLLLRIDPRQIFDGVQFNTLTQVSANPPMYQFSDNNVAASDIALFQGITSQGSYQFSFTPMAGP